MGGIGCSVVWHATFIGCRRHTAAGDAAKTPADKAHTITQQQGSNKRKSTTSKSKAARGDGVDATPLQGQPQQHATQADGGAVRSEKRKKKEKKRKKEKGDPGKEEKEVNTNGNGHHAAEPEEQSKSGRKKKKRPADEGDAETLKSDKKKEKKAKRSDKD